MSRIVFILISCFCTLSLLGADFTSAVSGDWNKGATWGNVGDVEGTDWPANTDNATIANGTTVTLTAADTIANFTINDGGVFDYAGFSLRANGTVTPFITGQSGLWGTNGTWLNGTAPGTTANAMIMKGHTITSATETINNLQINSGGTVKMNAGKFLTINGNWIHNGTWVVNNTGSAKNLQFGGGNISGVGIVDFESNVDAKALIIQGNSTVLSGTNISILGELNIEAGVTLTMNGALLINGDVTAVNATTSIITMNSESNLEVAGAMLATNGVLNTNAGSTVEYTSNSVAQTVKTPSAGYSNVLFTNAGIKSLGAALDVNGNLTILSGTLDVVSASNYAITVAGNWSNDGIFLAQNGTVTFDGSSDQTFDNGAGDSLYNLTINKSGGNLLLNDNLVTTNTVTFTAGNIDANGNKFSLGNNAEGTISGNGGYVIGQFEYYFGTGSTGDKAIRIGNSTDSTKATINFTTISTGGPLIFEFINSNPGNAGLSGGLSDTSDVDVTLYNTFVDGYWSITDAGSFVYSGTYDLSLEGNDMDAFSIDNGTRLLIRPNSGADWDTLGAHVPNNTPVDTVARTGLSTLSAQYAFGDDTNCTPPVTSAISGTTEVCTTDTLTYTVDAHSGNTYFWTVTGGTFEINAGTTYSALDSNSVDVIWSSTGQVGSVAVYENDPTCSNGEEVIVSVNVNTIAPTTMIGKTVLAKGSLDVSYSLTDAGYQYEWTITSGTLDLDNNNSITVDWGITSGTGQVSVVAEDTARGCLAATSYDVDVILYTVLSSNGTGGGQWSTGTTWDSGTAPNTVESVKILNGDSVWLSAAATINNVVVETGGILNLNGQVLTVDGNLEVDGSLQDDATGGSINLDGGTATPPYSIDGSGTISADININNGDKTVSSSASLTVTGTMTLAAGVEVTNEGVIRIGSGGTLQGTSPGSTWTNANGGNLIIEGTIDLTNLTLDLSNGGKTTFAGTASIPASLEYYDLEIAGTSNSLTGGTTVLNDFTLTSGTLAMGDNDLTIAGDITYEAGTITKNSGIVIFDGTTNQQYSTTNGSNLTIPNLQINNTTSGGDAVTLNDTLIVSDTLYLTDGIVGVDTASAILQITNCNTGAISGGSAASFINNALDRCTNSTSLYDYPLGDGTSYQRIGITPNAASANEFIILAFEASAGNQSVRDDSLNNVSGLEYWDIEQVSGTDDIHVRLYWNTLAESDIQLASDLRVAHYDDVTDTRWENHGNGSNSGDVDPGWVESNILLGTFSPVTFGSNLGDNLLPVTLLEFDGKSNADGTITLSWKTATEIKNDYFEIQRSFNGSDFETIGEVDGAGDSKALISYQFIDTNPYFGHSYYRLHQVDYDGEDEYSPLIRINHTLLNSSTDFRIAINPTTNREVYLISDDLPDNSIVWIKVYNSLGQQFYDNNIISKGHSIHIPVENTIQTSGLYIVSVAYGQETKTLRLLIR